MLCRIFLDQIGPNRFDQSTYLGSFFRSSVQKRASFTEEPLKGMELPRSPIKEIGLEKFYRVKPQLRWFRTHVVNRSLLWTHCIFPNCTSKPTTIPHIIFPKMATAAIIISSFDLENPEEYLQTTTPSAFAEVASEVGIHKVLPFLQTVCQSKRSWQIRRKGIKLVRQIAVVMGVGLLPHLKKLVEIIERGLTDEQQKVRIITALALAALAEASTPYGIDFRFYIKTFVVRNSPLPRERVRSLLEGHWVYHSFDGWRVCELLLQRSDGSC